MKALNILILLLLLNFVVNIVLVCYSYTTPSLQKRINLQSCSRFQKVSIDKNNIYICDNNIISSNFEAKVRYNKRSTHDFNITMSKIEDSNCYRGKLHDTMHQGEWAISVVQDNQCFLDKMMKF